MLHTIIVGKHLASGWCLFEKTNGFHVLLFHVSERWVAAASESVWPLWTAGALLLAHLEGNQMEAAVIRFVPTGTVPNGLLLLFLGGALPID